MVFFTCNACGSALKKNQVEKHRQFQCKRAYNFSCMDCSKDFNGDEYKGHVKCISEEEKYSAKGWTAKPGQNKNERKQTEWVAMVQDVVNNVGNSDRELTSILQRISQYENIPRKKPKFINFLRNSLGNRTNPALMDKAWDLISKALEKQKAMNAQHAANNKLQEIEESAKIETKRKHQEENEDPKPNKKSRTSDSVAETALDKPYDPMVAIANDEQTSQKIKWCTLAKTILRNQENKELPLKKFQKKIIPEYLNRMGDNIGEATVEVLWVKCLKKLSKNPKFKIHKEIIKLVS